MAWSGTSRQLGETISGKRRREGGLLSLLPLPPFRRFRCSFPQPKRCCRSPHSCRRMNRGHPAASAALPLFSNRGSPFLGEDVVPPAPHLLSPPPSWRLLRAGPERARPAAAAPPQRWSEPPRGRGGGEQEEAGTEPLRQRRGGN